MISEGVEAVDDSGLGGRMGARTDGLVVLVEMVEFEGVTATTGNIAPTN